MATLAEIRQKYPQYQDLSDEQLATSLHQKFYADMPFDTFAQRVGYGGGDPAGARRNGFQEVARQVGLAGRYLAEGVGGSLDFIANPVAQYITNPALRATLGENAPQAVPNSQYVAGLADKAGLPTPETATERVVGDASRLLSSAMTIGGSANQLASRTAGMTREALSTLGRNLNAQAAGAAGAGYAGGATREAGGGEGAQFAAALAGGLTAPAAAAGANRAAQPVSRFVQRVVSPPADVGQTIKVAFERNGMDWDALSGYAKRELIADAERFVKTGGELNPAAVARLAQFRNIGATPLLGDVTQDAALITQQRNLAKQQANISTDVGGPNLSQIQNQNAKQVLTTLDNFASSPSDAYATGEGLIGRVRGVDAKMQAKERALYGAARDSQGRGIPLDRAGFLTGAFDNLAKSNRAPWLPPQVREVLNTLSEGQGEFTVDTIDTLKTLLAQESRSTANGNVKAAISAVRSALDNVQPAPVQTGSTLPATGRQAAALQGAEPAAADSLKAFDRARRFARARREWQESSSFIDDALNGAAPDQFVQKHVLRGNVDDLRKMARLVGGDRKLRDAVRTQIIEHLKARGVADSDVTKFSGAALAKAFDDIGQRRLALFFTKREVAEIRAAVNVAKYMQSQPIGSAVNNSNTGALLLGRLSSVLTRGKNIPLVGPLVASPLEGITVNMQARQLQNVNPALALPVPAAPRGRPAAALLGIAAVPPRDD